jgi:hypothetical protein
MQVFYKMIWFVLYMLSVVSSISTHERHVFDGVVEKVRNRLHPKHEADNE